MKLRFCTVAFLIAGLLDARPSGAQVAEGFTYEAPSDVRIDEAAAQAKLVAWVEQAGRSQAIRVKNSSLSEIEVVSYQIIDCTNIMVKCGEDIPGQTIEPGETITLATIRPANRLQGYRYKWTFKARYTERRRVVQQARPQQAAAETPPPEPESGWTQSRIDYVDRVMPMLMRNRAVMGAAIVLVDYNGIQWSKGYGTEYADGPDISSKTVFRVGALGEPVIALTFIRLAAARGWSVMAPISNWAFAPAIPSRAGLLSAASIMEHTAGIEADQTRIGFRTPGGTPGWKYSPAGYSFLKFLVEATQGHDLEVFVRAMVTEPHSLGSMTIAPSDTTGMARGHSVSGEVVTSPSGPGVPLYSSAEDYAQFLIDASSLSGRDRATWAEMTRPTRVLNEELGVSWARGWGVARTGDWEPVVFQRDSGSGYSSLALVDSDHNLGLVIMTNSDGGIDLIADVLKMLDPRGHRFLEFDPANP